MSTPLFPLNNSLSEQEHSLANLHCFCCAVDFECKNHFVAIFIILKGYFFFLRFQAEILF